MNITLVHLTTTTTIIIMTVWGLCAASEHTIAISLLPESRRLMNMFIPFAIFTMACTRSSLSLGTMTMFMSDVHLTTTTITTMGPRKWLFLAIMTTFGSAALPGRITVIITDTRKWLFLETTITFGLTALLTDTATLKMPPFPVTMNPSIFSGQRLLQENKVICT